MQTAIDPRIADHIITTTVSRVWALPGDKIVCTRRVLKDAVAAAIQKAYEIGFCAGQRVTLSEVTRPGSPDRPPWMDIPLEDKTATAAVQIHLRPIVLRSLQAAGYHCLGDRRWVPVEQIIQLFYIGRKTATQIRAAIERLERGV